MPSFGEIFGALIFPIFAMLGAGYLLEKRLGIDLTTLSRVSLYLFIPSLAFTKIYESTVPLQSLGVAAGLTLILVLLMLALGWMTGKLMGSPSLAIATAATAAFYNSGNYGIPLVELAFRSDPYAIALQTVVVAVQNILTFTLGIMMLASGRQTIRRSLRETVQYPFVYFLIAAVTCRLTGWRVPHPLIAAMDSFAAALVPTALVTLGGQLARIHPGREVGRVLSAASVRLIGGPLVAFLLIRLFGLHGRLAQLILISAGVPTAVNITVLAVQYDHEPEFVSQATFVSTAASALTMTAVVYAAFHWL